MSKKKSEFVSAFDVSARVFKALANAVTDAGGEDDDLRRLETDESLRRRVGELIVGGVAVARTFAVWRPLEIGGKDAEGLLAALEKVGRRVNDWAKDIMSQPAFTTLPEPVTVELVRVKVRDLGFTKDPTTRELLDRERLARFDLDVCPAEVGPRLAIAYHDQPVGEWLPVAMEPITDSGGGPVVFDVGHGLHGRWLLAGWTGPGGRWSLGGGLVFVRRKSA